MGPRVKRAKQERRAQPGLMFIKWGKMGASVTVSMLIYSYVHERLSQYVDEYL